MKQHYSDAEIVELSMCLGSWLSFGRLNRVLGLDTACVLPSHYSKRETRGRLKPQGHSGAIRPGSSSRSR